MQYTNRNEQYMTPKWGDIHCDQRSRPISDNVCTTFRQNYTANEGQTNCNFITVHAHNSESSEEEIEQFYTDVNAVLRKLKNNTVTILMGAFNVKISCGAEEDIVEHHGL